MNTQIESVQKYENEVREHEVETAYPERDSMRSSEKCDFFAKSEAGLKTHHTVRHKTPLLKPYSKVSR